MATTSTLRQRRSAAQLHALARVEREIRATDRNGRRKYLRDFRDAFRSYESLLTAAQLDALLAAATIVLAGDYHALAASQRYAAHLVQQLAATSGRPVVLGLETIFARDQHIVDLWMRDEITDAELRERIRFDLDWGYEWQPFYDLLRAGREHAAAVYGLDCMPRSDMRRIGARDRHASAKIAEIRERHPDALILVLFGESHLAPDHLPLELRQRLPRERLLSVLQNVDALYWMAAGERRESVEAVRVAEDVVCVFNSTPLEKYESYRLCIERWRQERPTKPDLAPTIYNLIDALVRFLKVDKYSATNHTQPRFLVDLLPEVYSRPLQWHKLLREGLGWAELNAVQARVAERGCCYVGPLNVMCAGEFQMAHGAEEAARFVHHACRGALLKPLLKAVELTEEDAFYTRVLEHALAYFGSRVLYPARAAVRESDLYALYSLPREEVEGATAYSYREYMELLDFLVLHKDFEANHHQYVHRPALLDHGLRFSAERLDGAARQLGYMMGSELYHGYVMGCVAKRFIRSLFFRRLDRRGAARAAYFAAARKVRRPRKRLL